MGILLHLVTCFACLQAILSHPLHADDSRSYDGYRMRLAKRDSFYPLQESLLSSMGFFENSRGASHKKKAVDSTFIRFGRSSSSETNARHTSNMPQTLMEDPYSSPESSKTFKRFLLDHNGCQISNSKELFRALMTDRNCIQAFPKVKRESVNDTFIRFGKRSLPSEEQFESEISEDV